MVRVIDKTKSLDMTGLRSNVPAYLIIHSTRKYPTFDALYDHHKNDRSWNGVGYHLFFSEDGKEYLCRPHTIEGAHAIGFNTSSLGFCFYSSDGNLSTRRIRSIRDSIGDLADRRGLEIVSHTDAQLMYLNRLFKQEGLNYELPTGVDVVDATNFEKIKRQAEEFTKNLGSRNLEKFKLNIKDLKNCPGPIFKHLI